MFSTRFVARFPQLPWKTRNPSNIYPRLFRKFDLQYWTVKKDCIFVRHGKFYRRHRGLIIYHVVDFSTDSFDDTAIFEGVFYYPFCAFSVCFPGGSFRPLVMRFAAVIWLETNSLIMFDTIKIAIACHDDHRISHLLRGPKAWFNVQIDWPNVR